MREEGQGSGAVDTEEDFGEGEGHTWLIGAKS